MTKRVGLAFALLFALGGAFAWGVLVHRSRVFPYEQVKALSRSLGFVAPARIDVPPRTRRTSLDSLNSLPYLQSSHDVELTDVGTILHNKDLASEGYNFWNAWTEGVCRLMDMDGSVVHEWTYPDHPGYFHHGELLPNGDVIVTVKDFEIARINSFSEVLWKHEYRVHHDVWVGADGTVAAVAREERVVPEYDPARPILTEKLIRFSPDGDLIQEVDLSDLIFREGYGYLVPRIVSDYTAADPLDVFHVNHVERFDGSVKSDSPLLAEGNWLLSVRNLNAIMILNPELDKILWLWGPGNLSIQHAPTLLDNGNILIFDNGRSFSRVIEIHPPTGEIVWEYSDRDNFFSLWGGSAQRLPNGNTLIVETDRGRVFEVTTQGDTVWEFVNPNTSADGGRMNIWRMKRIDPASLTF